jgi:hypothetical protein
LRLDEAFRLARLVNASLDWLADDEKHGEPVPRNPEFQVGTSVSFTPPTIATDQPREKPKRNASKHRAKR